MCPVLPVLVPENVRVDAGGDKDGGNGAVKGREEKKNVSFGVVSCEDIHVWEILYARAVCGKCSHFPGRPIAGEGFGMGRNCLHDGQRDGHCGG